MLSFVHLPYWMKVQKSQSCFHDYCAFYGCLVAEIYEDKVYSDACSKELKHIFVGLHVNRMEDSLLYTFYYRYSQPFVIQIPLVNLHHTLVLWKLFYLLLGLKENQKNRVISKTELHKP